MLVVVGPPFEGSDADYAGLAAATGLVAYDLRAKLKPGYWGVVRALADVQAAEALAQRVASLGHRVAVVDPQVGHDEERRFVPLLGIDLTPEGCVLRLRGRDMEVPLAALLTLVRGEVQVGAKASGRSSASSTSLRAVTATAG
jgi:hypothetical protein